ncbi:4-phosphopantetheinyl transferase family protein [Corynebacterium hylobatis]|uniref:4-phosphopantetheinyl transferase family protein n=1 Tax=Corynebacterium hylobatis TaxID=1859290 RepID=A0A3S0BHD7_9CORY|nr:4'-phosphopantetheinyl transferase superfamily protein [Corynebacterium hylobatis]RSZ64466.1 4-phosphopantetheinyl transferase family protein [Corynebacterium hylobatis]
MSLPDLAAARIRVPRDVPADVEVHLFPLAEYQFLLDSHGHLLSPAEHDRARQGHSPEIRLLSHVLRRILLARRAGPAAGTSLSRTEDLIVVALAGRPVGVDVEKQQSPEQSELLLRLLHPADQRRLRGRPAAEVTAAWTRKEATLKAIGVGLQRDPGLDEVGTRRRPRAPLGWQVRQLTVPPAVGAELAVAWRD